MVKSSELLLLLLLLCDPRQAIEDAPRRVGAEQNKEKELADHDASHISSTVRPPMCFRWFRS